MKSIVLCIAVLAICASSVDAVSGVKRLRARKECKGKCQDIRETGCNTGSYVKGLCPGNEFIQCCTVPPTSDTPANQPAAVTPAAGGVTPPGTSGAAVTQKKPNFQKVWDAYPHGEAAEVKAHIGGKINAEWITNTCTIRVSRALNMGGAPLVLPFTLKNGQPMVTVSGAKGERYAIRVKEFTEYARKHFGKPDFVHSNGDKDGGPIPAEWSKHSGLIMFDVKVWSDATGHFDLWNGATGKCAHDCYFNKCREAWLWKWA